MTIFKLKWMRWGAALGIVLALLMTTSAVNVQPAVAQSAAADGIVCTTSANATFTLRTESGYIGMSDDNTVFMWGFSVAGQPFQHPSPTLCVNQGDTVTVIVQNTLAEDISLVFPGQENVVANGVLAAPQFTGGALTSLAPVATANGGAMTYSFVASRAGTFIYQSGTNPDRQVRMGLFGALIVRPVRPDSPPAGASFVYGEGSAVYKTGPEFMIMLSEVDPYLNQAVERGQPFDMSLYKPRYWLINGRGFPDSIASNFAAWLPTQPYGALARINPYDPTANPHPALVRYLNMGTIEFPFHPHGNNGRVVGRDGYPLVNSDGADLSFDKFAVNVGPGQTWDVTFDWRDNEGYNETTNPVPVTIPNLQNMVFGMFFSGSPYLGTDGVKPVGDTAMTQCGEYYIIAHNHALFQLDSWGVPMTGPATFTRVDPPLPNNCPQ
ncbi:MAG TPA: multicopper oxidase domain-containing protein [Caldilinea sp.]|nr:multicopper oxidase domain-containing protein [Anaerolineales bacterium]HRA66952.1 multicopper oxidase domain-containing protein [Caldilinea sp.]